MCSTALGRSLRFWVDTRRSDTGSRSGWEPGSGSARFLVDTGALFDLEISEALERQLAIEPDPEAERREGLNWIGRDRGRVQRLRGIRIGAYERRPPVDTPVAPEG